MTTHDQALRLAATALDFELSRSDNDELDAHLRGCVACRSTQRSFLDHATALRTRTRAHAPAHLRAEIMSERAPTFPIASGPARALVLAGLLIAAMVSALFIGAGLTRHTPTLPDVVPLSPIGKATDILFSGEASVGEHNCTFTAESNCATDVIVADGSVWTTSTDGVIRVDPASNAVIATIPFPNGFPQRLGANDDGIWVVAQNPGRLVRIDPATNTVAETVEVGGIPGGMAIDGRGIWVAATTEHALLHVDRSTRAVSRIVLDIAPWSVASTGDSIWVVDRYARQAMLEVDPVTETTVRAIEIPGAGAPSGWDYSAGVTVLGDQLVVLGKVEISIFDRATGSFVTHVGPTSPHAAVGGDSLWIVGGDRRMLQRWDPATNSEQVEQRLGIDTTADAVTWEHPVAYGFGAIWIRDYLHDRLIRIDPDPVDRPTTS